MADDEIKKNMSILNPRVLAGLYSGIQGIAFSGITFISNMISDYTNSTLNAIEPVVSKTLETTEEVLEDIEIFVLYRNILGFFFLVGIVLIILLSK